MKARKEENSPGSTYVMISSSDRICLTTYTIDLYHNIMWHSGAQVNQVLPFWKVSSIVLAELQESYFQKGVDLSLVFSNA